MVRGGVQVIELELATGNPMLYVYEDGAFKRRGSPVGPAVDGVYALTPVSSRALAAWDKQYSRAQ